MEFEFDKEIDALLRQTARGREFESATNEHLNADEISAFAENALPEKTKISFTAHLADCARCRKILSNLISLESETGTVVVASPVVKAEVVETKIPRYRRMFAMPNLAYTMGALVLLFSGLIAFIVLQSSYRNTSEVSQISEKPMDTKTASSEPAEVINANAAAPPPAAVATTNTNAATNSVDSSNALTSADSVSPTLNSSVNTNVRSDAKTSANTTLKNESINEAVKDLAKVEKQAEKLATGNSFQAESKTVAENQVRSESDESSAKQAPKPTVTKPMAAEGAVTAATSDSAKNEKEKKLASREAETTSSAGGKTFNRKNNVWYDAAYNNQSTTNIRRGSDEYKKLDSGLRNIVENLGGTVVIVWKSKAYRIQ